ncbi:DUF4238 domain-containing protein [Streptomyces mirabilis]|uniref:DUF4238 domain-containing protein n=1 Tax=Streptomyces mirabilis TaxID=68239 RepID=UPI0037B8FFAD
MHPPTEQLRGNWLPKPFALAGNGLLTDAQAPVRGEAAPWARHRRGRGTRDHTVPQMYLRHFAQHRARRQYELRARRIDKLDLPFPVMTASIGAEVGFYWGTTLDGKAHHACEELFTLLEGQAETVLKTLLDDRDWALTPHWPLAPAPRSALAWWMAAQVLRTTRQRKRLAHLHPPAEADDALPEEIARFAANNPHLNYIVSNIAAMAAALYGRPWGLGFSDMCLLTSDVPVAIWNRPDEEDQLLALAHSDVMLPLDPHRLLFLPNPRQRMHDPSKRTDHLLHVSGALGMALVDVAFDVADEFVVYHPQHDPWEHWSPSGPRQPKPWAGEPHSAPEYLMEYPVFQAHLNIESRWTKEHPPRRKAAS